MTSIRTTRLCLPLALFALLMVVQSAANPDPALLGCWRSQHVQTTYSDQSKSDLNGDCVGYYGRSRVSSRCHSEARDVENVSSYQVLGPNRLRIVPLDAATGKPKGLPAELTYRIDGQWLLIERRFSAVQRSGSGGPQPIGMRSMSIRVSTGAESECQPRGTSELRVGRTPVSSLTLAIPPGWQPLLVDPASHRLLGPLVNSNFLVGAFTPRTAAGAPKAPGQLVLILDDVRSGPSPVRVKEFAVVKQRLIDEVGAANVTCNLPDRICVTRTSSLGLVYTELYNVSGRVAMVNVTATTDSMELLTKSARGFVEQLRIGNQ